MTVSTEVNHEEYTGNGVTTVFPYRFRILKAENMIVAVADISGNETTLILNTDYTITGVGSYNGGNVVLTSPLQQDWQITLDRELPIVQETDFRNQGTFFAETHEDAFDYLTMLIQQTLASFTLALRRPNFIAKFFDALGYKISNLGDPTADQDAVTKKYADTIAQNASDKIDADFNKTLRVPENSVPALPNIANRANKVLTFDNNGNPVATVPQSGSAADVLAQLAKPTGAGLVGYNSTTVADALGQIAGGTVKSVDGIDPDDSGNVALNAVRISQSNLGATTNLQTVLTAGEYYQGSTGIPSIVLGYPVDGLSGVLKVYKYGGDVIQQYIGDDGSIWINIKDGASFSGWKRAAQNTALLAENGWFKDESTGFIIQWGNNNTGTITFSIPFPTKCVGVHITPNGINTGETNANVNSNSTATAATFSSGAGAITSQGYFWEATGY